ncbi:outer membrane protein assembly factor BamE [Ferrovum sp. PN-J185]|uniref:outer membrane protein assembly factor BamE n=1 Tax=Ferrovum sp. PN-J185 TaxID=1356306 RepID=UPI00079BE28D|nr:outer membrane protein assembly factor BamE [Ferrovum sp. PN-J185]KXW56161.1 outer membrane protein assembly factor BamE precursor [Ferrovum sp. PN-J185]MCC6067777.1 outer membrane protein assembly factor BamE [Ferrovum sp. PN-J185]MDE1892205.1 outer membrane protein assembly factor BamE [Betaproteobacteria bacterium]
MIKIGYYRQIRKKLLIIVEVKVSVGKIKWLRKGWLLSWVLLSACSFDLHPYKMEIQQGTAIDSKMVERLKPGMTRTQVSLVLGTPLLADPFHANQWDYIFYTREKGVLSKPYHLTVYFVKDHLDHFTNDYPPVKPAEYEGANGEK